MSVGSKDMPQASGTPPRRLDLGAVFAPACIAVYGASMESGSMGARAIENLRKGGFGGVIVPINPRHAGQTSGGLTWYRSAAEYGRSIDHAIFLVRADAVPALLEDSIAAGVRTVSVLSGGFSEIGPEGELLQSRITGLASAAGMRVLGPNCLGFVNVAQCVYASPASVFEIVWPRGGPLALISQSGAVAADLLARAAAEDMGASFWVSTGNEADLCVADCIEFACAMESIKVIALYLESLKDVHAFSAAALQARELGKRVVAIRPGRTPAGASAVQSHTAAMVTGDVLYEALFRKLGVLRVDGQRELIDVLRLAVCMPHRPSGLAIVTSSGGSGAMTADAAWLSQVPMAQISESGRVRMRALVPACSPNNPIDVTGATNQNPAMLPAFFSAVLDEPEVDCMVMIHGASMLWRDRAEKISAALIAMATRYPDKRILFVGMVDADIRAAMAKAGVPVFDDGVALVRAMGVLDVDPSHEPRESSMPMAQSSVQKMEESGHLLAEDDALDWVELDIGIPVVARRLVAQESELAAALCELPSPVAMKAVIAGVTHKTEIGAVRIGLGNEAVAQAAWRELAAICVRHGCATRVLVEAMVEDVVSEVLLSAFVDPLLGPFITVGAGGTLTERVQDLVVAPAPIMPQEALAMLLRLRSWRSMSHHRNGLKANQSELVDAMVKLSKAITRPPHRAGAQLVQVEINPFMLRPSGSCAVDAVVTLRAQAPG